MSGASATETPRDLLARLVENLRDRELLARACAASTSTVDGAVLRRFAERVAAEGAANVGRWHNAAWLYVEDGPPWRRVLGALVILTPDDHLWALARELVYRPPERAGDVSGSVGRQVVARAIIGDEAPLEVALAVHPEWGAALRKYVVAGRRARGL